MATVTKKPVVRTLVTQLVETPDDQERARIQSGLIELSAGERPMLRRELIKALKDSPGAQGARTRGWLANTLAKVIDQDDEAYDVLLRYLSVEHEESKWVRYWALEGLWSGASRIRAETLENILHTEKEPLLPLLARAIQAATAGRGEDPKLTAALSNPSLQYEALRALRIVPLPRYRPEVQSIEDDATDKKILWNARLALKKMDESVDSSKVTEVDPTDRLKPDSSAELSEAELKTGNRTGGSSYYSDDGRTVYIGGTIPLPVKDWTTPSTKPFRIWLAVLDTQALHALPSAPAALPPIKMRSTKAKRTETSTPDYVLLAAEDAGFDLYGYAEFDALPPSELLESLAPRAIQRFDPPIPGAELRRAVADPDLFTGDEPVELDDEQWAVIRELIRFHQPKLDSALPASLVEERESAVIDELTMPASSEVGSSFIVRMTVRNSGNTTWPAGQEFRVDGRISGSGSEQIQELTWSDRLTSDIPPGHELKLGSPAYTAPDAPGDYSVQWSFYGDTGSTSFEPVMETRSLQVRRTESAEKAAPAGTTKSARKSERPAPPPEAGKTAVAPADTTAAPPPIAPGPPVTREIVRIRELYQTPVVAQRLILDVKPDEAKVTFDRKEYYSSFAVPADLLALSQQPQAYGERLFKAVFNHSRSRRPHGATWDGYRTAMAALEKAPENRFRFELTISPELEYLNWERLAEPDSARPPFSTNERLPFYRRVGNTDFKPVDAPLKVVVAICSPGALGQEGNDLLKNLPPLQVAEERESFRLGLEPLRKAGLAEYRILGRDDGEPVTLEALTDAVRGRTHLLHLLAHGLFIEGDYYIVMERKDGGLPFVRAKQLAELVCSPGSPLRLAILVACESGVTNSKPGTGAALGNILVENGFPAVIGMQEQLGLRTAQIFNQRFYFHLARSGRIETALAATRFDLRQGKVDLGAGWSIPMLHLGAETGELFKVDEERASRLADTPPRVFSDEQLRRAERSGVEHLREALRGDALAAGLSESQLGAISRGVHKSLGQPTAEDEEQLTQAQNLSTLQRALPHRVRLMARELEQAVSAATKLNMPGSVYDQAASAINAGKHVVLIGPPGTGKTRLAHAICEVAADRGFSTGTIPTTASADWTTFDTVGGYVPTTTQHLEFRPGIFLRAISSGRWLVVDEINRAEIDKAVGELFTVLSGQQVDLPYRVAGHPVRILPFKKRALDDWIPEQARPQEYDYVVHPNWRILATMNIYDKSSLFSISFAFMRRFAFVDVGVPDDADYRKLRTRWIEQERESISGKFPTAAALETALGDLARRFSAILDRGSVIMRYRELGPAIAEDMIGYIFDRGSQEEQPQLPELLAEAFLLYAVPQMDGLSRDVITALYCHLRGDIFKGVDAGEQILNRIVALYPHIPATDWETAFQQWQSREKPMDNPQG